MKHRRRRRKKGNKMNTAAVTQMPLLPPASSTTTTHVPAPQCNHNGVEPVKIGGFDVWLGAGRALSGEKCLDQMDYIVTLNGSLPSDLYWGQTASIVYAELQDYGGVPEKWGQFIKKMAQLIRDGEKIVAFCVGGHGRTGTFGASLIAEMEPETEDPIAAIRERHCYKAVESVKQAIAVYAIRGQELPEKWKEEFKPKASAWSSSTGSKSFTWSRDKFYKMDTPSPADETFDQWFDAREKIILSSYKHDKKLAHLSAEQLAEWVRRCYRAADLTGLGPWECEKRVPQDNLDATVTCVTCGKEHKRADVFFSDVDKDGNYLKTVSTSIFECIPCFNGEGPVECSNCNKKFPQEEVVRLHPNSAYFLCKTCEVTLEEEFAGKSSANNAPVDEADSQTEVICCNCQQNAPINRTAIIDDAHALYLCEKCQKDNGTPSAFLSQTTSGLLDDFNVDWVS